MNALGENEHSAEITILFGQGNFKVIAERSNILPVHVVELVSHMKFHLPLGRNTADPHATDYTPPF